MTTVGGRCSTEGEATKESFRKSASSTLVSLEYSNGWDPLADGRSGAGFSQEVSPSLRFNMEEVESATQYFSELNLLGKKNSKSKGGAGSSFAATYRGTLRDGTPVVVTRLGKTCCKQEEAEFLKGLKLLAELRHDNIVGLRGFCCSRARGECFLVHDFVPNGSLSHFLDVAGEDGGGGGALGHGGRVLEWSTRVSIIKGIAKGMVGSVPLCHCLAISELCSCRYSNSLFAFFLEKEENSASSWVAHSHIYYSLPCKILN